MSNVHIPNQGEVTLIPFCGHDYRHNDYGILASFKYYISKYSMCMNSSINLKDYIYVDGCPCIHGNIAGFINGSKKQCRNEIACLLRQLMIRKYSLLGLQTYICV
jgi:hypothetical protein